MNNIIGSLPDFVAGMAAAFFYAQRGVISRRFLVVVAGWIAVYLGLSLKDTVWTGFAVNYLLATTETLFTVGATLLLLVSITSTSRVVQWLLANRPIRLMGMMCFSLYLQHAWLIRVVRPVESIPRLVVYLLLLAGFSWLTYRFVEFPQRKWRDLLPEKFHRTSAIVSVP